MINSRICSPILSLFQNREICSFIMLRFKSQTKGVILWVSYPAIFKARDTPENRTVGSAYTFYMGGTAAGKIVTERLS